MEYKMVSRLTFVLLCLLTLSSCKKNKTEDLIVNIVGLEDLGSNFVYEGWIIVEGSPISTGTFTVDGNGTMSQTTFPVNKKNLEDATEFVLTIEPANDSDPQPSQLKILAGEFVSFNTAGQPGHEALLSHSHSSAIGVDLSAAAGSYILATPTDGTTGTNETSGLWWLDPAGAPDPSLSLPTLPAGWTYEGWVVINGTPLSTGTFDSNSGSDNASTYSGTTAGPPFPGEDFLLNAPSGFTFPTDLTGQKVVISVEPIPDNSPDPFLIKPLVHDIPDKCYFRNGIYPVYQPSSIWFGQKIKTDSQ